ncbi:esterase/lipase family protein [Fluviicola chungangensis]|uniref:Phospholipase n=1 Tax=Fluviicola chungangensis TaxID=2597671 RepID=A0A556MZR3_9FLAO|nr:phospholipase [Fluviicola chungangensis]TSJ45385.1 phospholipase [Fluviicola chungangensis]
MKTLTLAFVHGYSVTNLDTYGEMPLRLMQEAGNYGYQLKIEHIFLGRYISFNDEVRLEDIARAMEQAVQEQLIPNLVAGERFACITHSTGGPVVRTWWNNYYKDRKTCPMSHLVMLAPANYGSALAQLGKSRLSRIKSWFDGVEPGQRVLNWLELGSSDAWKLNKDWTLNGQKHIGPNGIFPFSLIGQDIDRKLYDHLNSYTGELGSDGVVRVAAANQNGRYVKLKQETPKLVGGTWQANKLEISDFREAPPTPFRVMTYKSHSGAEMGIMRSPLKDPKDPKGTEVVNAIFRCIGVTTDADYKKLTADFANETADVQLKGLVEEDKRLFGKKYYIHDRYSMILFRLVDSEGHPVTDFDLILTGANHDPNALPVGFFADRQCNQVNKSTVTYFFNYDVLHGRKAMTVNGVKLDEMKGINELGLIIRPRPDDGFIRYLPCEIHASKELFDRVFQPNATTMIDICIQRVVSNEVFRFEKVRNTDGPQNLNFKKVNPGNGIVK